MSSGTQLLRQNMVVSVGAGRGCAQGVADCRFFRLLHGLGRNDVLLKDPVDWLCINLCVWQVATVGQWLPEVIRVG